MPAGDGQVDREWRFCGPSVLDRNYHDTKRSLALVLPAARALLAVSSAVIMRFVIDC